MVFSSSTRNDNSDSPMNTNNSIQCLGEQLSHIASLSSWREVIQQLLEGCPEKDLLVHLCNWPAQPRTKLLKYNFHDWKLIASKNLKLGEELGLNRYEPDTVTLKEL